jgi:oligopeptide transport system ATP-binding protein
MANEFLEVRGLKKYFEAGKPSLFSRETRHVHAVDGVDFTLRRSEVIALVGESGCGKSTLALLLMGLEEPTDGTILFEGEDITHLNDRQRKQKDLRRKIQMVFQDPYESLNPTQTIDEIVTEPLLVHGMLDTPDREERVTKALEDAGLETCRSLSQPLPARTFWRTASTCGDRRRAGA